ncbi:MAG: tetratricopeptide repeat protein [Firmicutes bacterium]|nr:tetratricopeptide repeat protein [Candidatus Caballimonas caccae]
MDKEDYEEPCCPFKTPDKKERVDIGRVISKLDEYLNVKDYDSCERHLIYWLTEAKEKQDDHSCLTIYNEQVGLYRKIQKEKECLTAIESALNLVEKMGSNNTISLGTTYLNCATGYKAFDKDEKALELYKKAKVIYEKELDKSDSRLAGLYNNMAVAYMDLKYFSESEILFNNALSILENKDNNLDCAITYCNLCDLYYAKDGIEKAKSKIADFLFNAYNILNDEKIVKDGYYAFVCEKCALTFNYYGYEKIEKDLLERAKEIYERA